MSLEGVADDIQNNAASQSQHRTATTPNAVNGCLFLVAAGVDAARSVHGARLWARRRAWEVVQVPARARKLY